MNYYKVVDHDTEGIHAVGEGLGLTIGRFRSVSIGEAEYTDLVEAMSKAAKSPDGAETGRFEDLVIDGTVNHVPDESERGYHITCQYYRHDLEDMPPLAERTMPESAALDYLMHGDHAVTEGGE